MSLRAYRFAARDEEITMKHGLKTVFGFVAGALLALGAGTAGADAVGPYYATPSWDQTLPGSTRFIILSNLNSEAVLDRETGLVWQRTPLVPFGSANPQSRSLAINACWSAETGRRKGWCLPRVDELMSLADPSNFAVSPLPAGNPFVGVINGAF